MGKFQGEKIPSPLARIIKLSMIFTSESNCGMTLACSFCSFCCCSSFSNSAMNCGVVVLLDFNIIPRKVFFKEEIEEVGVVVLVLVLVLIAAGDGEGEGVLG